MKKLILAIFLVCVLTYTPVLADIDTFEGQATENLSSIEGQDPADDIDKIEGQTIDPGVPAFCDCTGSTLFCWPAESRTVTEGTPPGCSNGSDFAGIAGTPEISPLDKVSGTNSVLIDSTGGAATEYYSFAPSNRDIFDETNGCVELKVNVETFGHITRIYKANYLSPNYAECYTGGSAGSWDIFCRYNGGGTINSVSAGLSINEATQGWFGVKHCFKQNEAGIDHYVGVDLNMDGTYETEVSEDDDLTAWASPANVMVVGNTSSTVTRFFVDDFIVTNDSGL